MAKANKHDQLVPSVLDRLLGNTVSTNSNPANYSYQHLKEMRLGIRRDLEDLFNSRYRITEFPVHLSESENSVINYGLPDLSTINVIDPANRAQFCRQIKGIIERFEPRFRKVKVSYIDNIKEDDRSLRFRIEAILLSDPISEPIVISSVLEPVDRSIKIEDIQ